MAVETETKDVISIFGVFIAALLGYWIANAKEKRERKLMKVALLEELNDVRIELLEKGTSMVYTHLHWRNFNSSIYSVKR
ncbi:MAG: tmRNA-binding protein [Polaribacter sp.]